MGQSMLPISGGGGFDLEAGNAEKVFMFSTTNYKGQTNVTTEVGADSYGWPSWFKSCKKALILYYPSDDTYTTPFFGFLGETFTWKHKYAGTVTTTYSVSSNGRLLMANTCTSGSGYTPSVDDPKICIIGLD